MPSVDEYLNARKSFVKSGDRVMKAFKAPPSWGVKGERTARFIMSSDTPDRDKDIIHPQGIDLKSFGQNPVALLFHQSREFPIGTWSDLSKNLAGSPKTLEGTLNFLPEGVDETADRAAKHVQHGTIRAVSIGFVPKSIRAREGDPDSYWNGYEILECELVECSVVPVPAQPDAIVKAAEGGEIEFRAARELIEEILDTYTKTPTGLIVPRAQLEAAYKEVSARQTAPSREAEDAKELPDPEPQAPEGFFEKLTAAVVKALSPVAAKEPEPPAPPPPAPNPEAADAARRKAAETLARLKAKALTD